jgi:type IV secretory pathway VirB6-like protein
MPPITPYFTFIWTAVTSQMATASSALVGSLQGVMSSWFVLLVPAYLVVLVFIGMWSGNEETALRFLRQLMAAAIVYTLVSLLPEYQYWITGVVHGTVARLTQAVLGSAEAAVPESFGHIAVKVFDVGFALARAVPAAASYAQEAMLGLAVVLYFALAAIIIGVVFAAFLIASVLTDYVMSYGPIFIAAWFFEPTRMFFDGWFRSLVAGMLVQLFLVGDLAMMTVTMTGFMALISPSVKTTSENAKSGDIGFILWNTFGVLILLSLFALIAGISIYLAVTISGGAHHQLVRLPRPGGGNNPSRSPTPSGGSGGGGSVQPAGGSGGSIQPASGSPPRSYAFQNTTPMGPPP